ncbi:MAG: FG-GAP and VCBS repeat-containing protein [Acidobacteriota bacterium]
MDTHHSTKSADALCARHPCRLPLLALAIGSTFLPLLPTVGEAQFPTADPPYQAGFPVTLNGTQVEGSSIALGDVNGDGLPDIVVGARDGKVHAYTGAGVKLWEFDTGDMGVSSKAAIADLDLDGTTEVVIGAGKAEDRSSSHGDLFVISHTGQLECTFQLQDTNSDSFRDGVFSSPAVADIDGNDGGQLEIIFGAWDKRVRVIHHDCSVFWERFQLPPTGQADYFFDSVWSSPAIGDIDGNGQLDVVIGCDSPDASPNVIEPGEDPGVGGALHVLDGQTGLALPGFPIAVDEVIYSSPALADLVGGDELEITVGTGRCWENPVCAVPPAGVQEVDEAIFAWDQAANPLAGWPVDLSTTGNLGDGTYAFASPALADIDSDGQLEVIINTQEFQDNNGGQVHAINVDGSPAPGAWPVRPVTPAGPGTTVSFSTSLSPIVADITGDSDLEIILPSNWELVVFDEQGNQLSRDLFPVPTLPDPIEMVTNGPIGGAAAVGDLDGDGDLEVVVGSYATLNPPVGAIYVWDFPDPKSAADAPWPMFRRSTDNHARVDPATIFTDGFETGDTTAWQ